MKGMVRRLDNFSKSKLIVVAGEDMDDPELEAIKARVRAMEEESEKLRVLQSEVDKQLAFEEKMDLDSRKGFNEGPFYEIILEFGHKATMKDDHIKVFLDFVVGVFLNKNYAT